jgi:hypothetical protein
MASNATWLDRAAQVVGLHLHLNDQRPLCVVGLGQHGPARRPTELPNDTHHLPLAAALGIIAALAARRLLRGGWM